MGWIIGFVSLILLISIIAITAYTQYLTEQGDRVGILMLGDERIFHFVSAAKNAVAFLRNSLSGARRFQGLAELFGPPLKVVEYPLAVALFVIGGAGIAVVRSVSQRVVEQDRHFPRRGGHRLGFAHARG